MKNNVFKKYKLTFNKFSFFNVRNTNMQQSKVNQQTQENQKSQKNNHIDEIYHSQEKRKFEDQEGKLPTGADSHCDNPHDPKFTGGERNIEGGAFEQKSELNKSNIKKL